LLVGIVRAGTRSCQPSIIFYRDFSAVPTAQEAALKLEGSLIAVPRMPNLVLLPPLASLDPDVAQMRDGDTSVLGLGLMQRTVMAARRAGYGRIFFLARNHPARPDITAVPDWSMLADALHPQQATSLVIAPATILSETHWLKSLATTTIEPMPWAAITHRIVLLAATAVPDALAVLQAERGACDLRAVGLRLTRRFGPPAAISHEIDPMVLERLQDIPVAEQRLLRGLVKETDGFTARHFDRHVSLQISRRLAPTSVKPSQVTLISIAIGLSGAPFFLSELWHWQTLGALLFLLHSIVDGCDGELARLKFQESKYGGILDFWGDNIVHVGVFGCMAVGWAQSAAATWPLWLGATAIIATLGSAGFVYWRQLRPKDGNGPLLASVSDGSGDFLAGALDALSRRDFIYIVPMLAAFGKANWLLLFAAVGTPIFFFLLVFQALRGGFQRRRTTFGNKPARPSGKGSA
jgi:1L-myo-inositol 1-phosphate cytidylyltransferase / CDP-L-myo-inositol myo-inositolphosphotransferase